MAAFLGPLDPEPVIERLKAQAQVLQLVDGAAELEAILDAEAPRRMPAAFVVMGPERSQPSTGTTGAMMQRTVSTLGIVIVVSNLRSASTGAAAAQSATPVERAVMECIYGWRHPEAELQYEHVSREVLKVSKGVLYVQHAFVTEYRKEKWT